LIANYYQYEELIFSPHENLNFNRYVNQILDFLINYLITLVDKDNWFYLNNVINVYAIADSESIFGLFYIAIAHLEVILNVCLKHTKNIHGKTYFFCIFYFLR
jgi:hypothetical protein